MKGIFKTELEVLAITDNQPYSDFFGPGHYTVEFMINGIKAVNRYSPKEDIMRAFSLSSEAFDNLIKIEYWS